MSQDILNHLARPQPSPGIDGPEHSMPGELPPALLDQLATVQRYLNEGGLVVLRNGNTAQRAEAFPVDAEAVCMHCVRARP